RYALIAHPLFSRILLTPQRQHTNSLVLICVNLLRFGLQSRRGSRWRLSLTARLWSPPSSVRQPSLQTQRRDRRSNCKSGSGKKRHRRREGQEWSTQHRRDRQTNPPGESDQRHVASTQSRRREFGGERV